MALLALLAPAPARADWAGDEAHRKKLRQRLATLKTAIAAYERDRRQMDMIRAGVAAMKLPFADPRVRPDVLVRRVISARFPGVSAAVQAKLVKRSAHQTLERWRLRCTLRGDFATLIGLLVALPRYGLFVEPPITVTPGDPTTVQLVGLHVRLDLKASGTADSARGGADAYASRTDELARDIRKLRGEIDTLKRRVLDIRSFESNLKAVERFIAMHRRGLSPKRVRRLRRLLAALSLDALHIRTARLSDHRSVRVTGSARTKASRRRLERYAKRKRWLTLELTPPQVKTVDATEPDANKLHARGARALEIGAYAGARVVVALEQRAAPTLDKSLPRRRSTLGEAQTMAKLLGLTLRRRGRWALLAPRLSRRALRGIRGGGRHIRLALLRKPLRHALSFVAQGKRTLMVERRLLSRSVVITLSGRERRQRWIALVAAALGARFRRQRDRIVIGDPTTALRISPREVQSADAVTKKRRRRRQRRRARQRKVRVPLAAYRLRIVASGRAVASSGGTAKLLRRGRRIGHSRARKVSVTGVTLRSRRATFRWPQ